MTWRVRLFWALALAAAVGYGLTAYLRSLQDLVPVVVAGREIPARTVLTAEMLQVIRVPAEAAGALAPRAFATAAAAAGAVTVRDIARDEVIRDDPRWLTRRPEAVGADGRARLGLFLPPEGRAVTVTVDAQGLVGNHVKAGDRVDVLFTSRGNNTGGVYAATILQGALVLAVDRLEGSAGQYNVTLLATPEQALDLTLAKRQGQVDLALVPPAAAPAALAPVSPLKFAGRTGP